MDKLLDLVYAGFPIVFVAALISMVLTFFAIFRCKYRTRIKIIFGAFACYAEAQFSAMVVMLSRNTLPNGFSINSLGLFGFQMFMLAENILTDSHIDNGDKKYRIYRWLPAISVVLASGLIAWCIGRSGENLLASLILSLPFLPISYFATKRLIFPDKRPKPKSFIVKFTPFELLFYISDMLCYGVWYRGYEMLSFAFCVVEAIAVIAMGIVIFREFRRWEE